MASTLWDKFKTAVRWVVANDDAAIAVMQAADTPEPARLLDAAGADNGAPSASGDGVSVAGLREVNLYYRHATSGETSKVDLFLYDGDSAESSDADRWFRYARYDLGKDEDVFETLELEGNWERVYARLVDPPANTVTMKVSPHHESSNTD